MRGFALLETKTFIPKYPLLIMQNL